MSEEQLIIVDNVSKQYNLDFKYQQNFGEFILNKQPKPHSDEAFYALKNVSFSLTKGNVLGIVGRNGAGKSTLLRLLSGITRPTEGEIIINGSVTSILDIGTGFHPDLTGTENIKMVSALNGYSKAQFNQICDKVLSFSDIGEFVNIPVKYYSSGMFLRLAFSTAINFLSDVVVLDEVMAVGDAKFQQRCLQEIQRLKHENRTIVMVSHSMNSISNYCNIAMCLEKGEMVSYGEISKVLRHYITEEILGIQHQGEEEDEAEEELDSEEETAETEVESTEEEITEEKTKLEIANESDHMDTLKSIEEGEEEVETEDEADPADSDLMDFIKEEEIEGFEIIQKEVLLEEVKNNELQLSKKWSKKDTKDADIAIRKITVLSATSSRTYLPNDEEIIIEFVFDIRIETEVRFAVNLRHQLETQVMATSASRSTGEKRFKFNKPGQYLVTCHFPANFFNVGLFTLDAFFTDADNNLLGQFPEAFHFYVDHVEANADPTDFVHYLGLYQGPLAPMLNWESKRMTGKKKI